jgi:hypothetical protein
MVPPTDYHNIIIDKVITLFDLILKNYNEIIKKEELKELDEIKNIYNKAYKHFLKLKNDL